MTCFFLLKQAKFELILKLSSYSGLHTVMTRFRDGQEKARSDEARSGVGLMCGVSVTVTLVWR